MSTLNLETAVQTVLGKLASTTDLAKPDGAAGRVDRPSAMGAFSQVDFYLGLNGKELAVKSPRPDADIDFSLRDHAMHLLKAEAQQRLMPSMPEVFGVWGVQPDGEAVRLSTEELEVQLAFVEFLLYFESALPEQAVQLLDYLGSMGLSTIQDGRSTNGKFESMHSEELNLQKTYEQIVEILSGIHAVQVEGVKSPERYKTSLTNIIVDTSRYDGVSSTPPARAIETAEINHIRSMMLELVDKFSSVYFDRLALVHGDAWASNFFYDENGQVYAIDPGGVGESDPALDVAFALTDLALLDVKRSGSLIATAEGNNQHRILAEELLMRYETMSGDQEIRAIMPLFMAYKLFVSAIFDSQGNPQLQQELLTAIKGMLKLSLNEGIQFSYNDLQQYYRAGLEHSAMTS